MRGERRRERGKVCGGERKKERGEKGEGRERERHEGISGHFVYRFQSTINSLDQIVACH